MTKTIYAIDEKGFMTYETMEIEGEEIPVGYIDVPLPTDQHGNQLPFWKPRWTGTEWIETRPKEEIEAEKLKPKPPSELEMKLKEKEIQIAELKEQLVLTNEAVDHYSLTQQELLELLIDMGVI